MIDQNSKYPYSIGFLLVETGPAKEREVYFSLKDKVKEVEGVESVEVHPLFGEWDMIVKVEVTNGDVLEAYQNFVKEVPGVVYTKMLQARSPRKY